MIIFDSVFVSHNYFHDSPLLCIVCMWCSACVTSVDVCMYVSACAKWRMSEIISLCNNNKTSFLFFFYMLPYLKQISFSSPFVCSPPPRLYLSLSFIYLSKKSGKTQKRHQYCTCQILWSLPPRPLPSIHLFVLLIPIYNPMLDDLTYLIKLSTHLTFPASRFYHFRV